MGTRADLQRSLGSIENPTPALAGANGRAASDGRCQPRRGLYREAIAIAQPQSAKLWELRAAMSLARLWREQGKCAEARDLLAPVYGWFTEGFGTPVLQKAKLLLDELAGAPGLVASGGLAVSGAGAAGD
jgi:hypothetical protein